MVCAIRLLNCSNWGHMNVSHEKLFRSKFMFLLF